MSEYVDEKPFWAIVDPDGDIATIKAGWVGEIKAIFADKSIAEEVLSKSYSSGGEDNSLFTIVPVEIFEY